MTVSEIVIDCKPLVAVLILDLDESATEMVIVKTSVVIPITGKSQR
jgi:hypothetical protein